MIQLTEGKKEKLSSYAEGILSMAEKLMECIDSLEVSETMGERSRYGSRMPMEEGYENYAERRLTRR